MLFDYYNFHHLRFSRFPPVCPWRPLEGKKKNKKANRVHCSWTSAVSRLVRYCCWCTYELTFAVKNMSLKRDGLGCLQALIPLALGGTDTGRTKAAQALAKIAITADPRIAFPGERVCLQLWLSFAHHTWVTWVLVCKNVWRKYTRKCFYNLYVRDWRWTEVMFLFFFVCEQDISKSYGFGRNLVDGLDVEQGQIDSILVKIQIQIRIRIR